jgi:class 3 adenylate cyclase
VLELFNPHDRELVVRLERTAPRDDALTAARASALALFRRLFPAEVLAPGQLVSVSTVNLLLVGVEGADALYERLGEAGAFGVFHEHLLALEGHFRSHGGALVKAVGEGALAAFPDAASAVRAALALPPAEGLRRRAVVHRGPALAATINDHLDYFGLTVRQAERLLELAGADVLLSQAVMDDPRVAEQVHDRAAVERADLPGLAGAIVHRVSSSPLRPPPFGV